MPVPTCLINIFDDVGIISMATSLLWGGKDGREDGKCQVYQSDPDRLFNIIVFG